MSKSPGGQSAYLYLAAGATGGRKLGLRRASSPRHLAEQLRRERLVPLKNWSVPVLGTGAPAEKLSVKDQVELNFNLAQLLGRGVPLVEALEVAGSAVTAKVRPVVEKMREQVASGSGFADACRSVGVFDPVTVGIYRAAERTGDLGGAAGQLAATFKRQKAVRDKAVSLLIYPALVLSISTIVSAFMLTVIVPNIGKTLENASVELPGYSAVVIGAGRFVREYWPWFLGGVLSLLTAAVLARKALASVALRVVRKIPIIQDVLLAQESARFFTVMSAMTRAGVTLSDGLGMATQAVNDPALNQELTRLRTKLVEGGVLRQLIEDVRTLPLATRRLLIAGERSGDLQTVFETLSADLTDEVDRKSTRLLNAMEPVLIVIMFVMIGSLLVSILIPLMNMAQNIG